MDVIHQIRTDWQAVQDALAGLAGIYLQTMEADRPTSTPSQENPICQMIHALPEGKRACLATCQRQWQIALQSEETTFFSCPANLHMFAIPVLLPYESSQLLLGGKTYYSYGEFAELQEQAIQWGLDGHRLLEGLQQTRFGSSTSLHETARWVESIGKSLLENIHLRRRFEIRATRLTTLIRVLSEPSLAASRSALFEAVLNFLGVLYDVQSGIILTEEVAGEGFKAEAAFGKLKTLGPDHRFSRSGLIERTLETERPVSSRVTFDILKIGLPRDTESVHLFPIKCGHRLEGILLLVDTRFSPEELQTVDTFTQLLSPVLENLHLREDMKGRTKMVRMLTEITHVISASLDSNELFQSILEKTTEFLQAEQGSLMVLEEKSSTLAVQAIKGLNKTLVEMLRIQPGEGISGKVYQSGLPLLVQDVGRDDRISHPPRSRYKTGSFICAPLRLHDRALGVINLADKIGGGTFSEDDLQLLTAIGAYASVAIERSVYHRKTEELRKISITDSLTGLLNRRYFQERLTEEIERSRRHRIPVSLMIIDIDDFKGFNDTFGHLEGDEILKTLTHAIRQYIRAIDVAARYGGEEFTVILPQTSKQDAAVIAERICRGIERNEAFQQRFVENRPLTVSIGLAAFPDDAASIESLVRHADEALYAAKSLGKNRVIFYTPPD